jgi:hypothetical protein
VSRGGTGIASGTSGGVLYFSGSSTIASSGALSANQLVLGGGAGSAPTSLSAGTTTTVLHGNASGAPTFGAVALGTDTSGNYVANTNTSVLTGLTGGSAGSAGASLTLGLDYSATLAANPALASGNAVFGTTGLIFEGATADTFEGLLTLTDPTADNTWTLPNASGTIALGTGTANQVAYWTATNTLASEAQLAVSRGGTGIASGTSGGVLYFSGSSTIASSGALSANQLVLGGGAGSAPTSLSAGTTTTVLHGNASGAPTFGAVALGTDTSGNYVANTNTSVLTGLTGGSAGSAGASLTLGLDYSQGANFTTKIKKLENNQVSVNFESFTEVFQKPFRPLASTKKEKREGRDFYLDFRNKIVEDLRP